jgi:predicted AAA+ superfamily ATPase
MQLISQELYFDKLFIILSQESKILQTDVRALNQETKSTGKKGIDSGTSHMPTVFSYKSVTVINSNIKSILVSRWLDDNL